MNNPLNKTDPTGFFWSKLWKELKPFIGTIVTIVVTFVCPACGPIVAGMIGGAVGAAANGGNILMGAAFGAFSGAAGGIGGIGGFITRGMIGGMQTAMAGGKFGSGFLAAGVGGMGGGEGWTGFVQAAVLGGVASEITGGKFKNGAATAAFMHAVGEGVKKYGAGGTPTEKDAKKVGECADHGRCTPADFNKSPTKKQEVLDKIQELSKPLVGKSFGSGEDGTKAAALALHHSGLVEYSRELGIEFYAVINSKGVITEISTAFTFNEASWGASTYGDSIWHTHPAQSPINDYDVVNTGLQSRRWIFASGRDLMGVDTYTTGLSKLSPVSAVYNLQGYTFHTYVSGSWETSYKKIP